MLLHGVLLCTVRHRQYQQRACCSCVHEPLGESLSVSRSGDAGFTRSAIIGKPEKKEAKGVRGRGIDRARHTFSPANGSSTSERRSRGFLARLRTRKTPSRWFTDAFGTAFPADSCVWDSTEANENRSKQRGGGAKKGKHTETALCNASHFFPLRNQYVCSRCERTRVWGTFSPRC